MVRIHAAGRNFLRSPFLPFFIFRKKRRRKKAKLQLGLRGGSDFPFVRVAEEHTAYVLFGLAGGSRATAALPSEPSTLRRKESENLKESMNFLLRSVVKTRLK